MSTTSNSPILGNVDLIAIDATNGWAFVKNEPNVKLSIDVYDGERLVCTGEANRKRDDLNSIQGSDGMCAFYLKFEAVADPECITVVARNPITNESSSLPFRGRMVKPGVKTGYQSFDNQEGDSNSSEKLSRIRLPASLEGMSVLDIGCNEGFFSIEAKRRGAARVVGVDMDKDVIERARERAPDIDYRVASWWDIPDEKFDLIFFFSAIHYEKDPKKLLSWLMSHLTERGKLVLECGVATDSAKVWKVVRRHDGFVRFPSLSFLTENLLAGYAVTLMGPSVSQSGDPVGRLVFHCTRKKPTCLLIEGKSGVGKTILALEFAGIKGVSIYSTDSLFHEIKMLPSEDIFDQTLLRYIQDHCDLLNIDTFINTAVEVGWGVPLAQLILERVPLESDFVVIEGYALSNSGIRGEIENILGHRGFVTWVAHRSGMGNQ